MKILSLYIVTNTGWSPVPEYSGIYEINKEGIVKRIAQSMLFKRGVQSFIINKPEKILTQSKTKKGYLTVYLVNKHVPVHRAVAITFISNPLNKPQVNHIDGDKENNDISNLEWATASENIKHSHRIGLSSARKGEINNKSKLKSNDVLKIRQLSLSGLSQYKIAKLFNIDRSNVGSIVNRKTWKHI